MQILGSADNSSGHSRGRSGIMVKWHGSGSNTDRVIDSDIDGDSNSNSDSLTAIAIVTATVTATATATAIAIVIAIATAIVTAIAIVIVIVAASSSQHQQSVGSIVIESGSRQSSLYAACFWNVVASCQ